jgi:hypothetical protein
LKPKEEEENFSLIQTFGRFSFCMYLNLSECFEACGPHTYYLYQIRHWK